MTPRPEHGASSRMRVERPARGAGQQRVGAHHLGRLGAVALQRLPQRVAAPRILLDAHQARAGVADQLGQVAGLAARRRARVEHPHAGPGIEQRRDALRRAAHRHGVARRERRGGGDVDRAVEHDRRRHRRRRRGTDAGGVAARPRRARARPARTRSAASAGSLPASISARAIVGAVGVEPQLGDPVGIRPAQRGVGGGLVGQRCDQLGAAAATRRRIAFTRPAAPRPPRLADEVDGVATAAWAARRRCRAAGRRRGAACRARRGSSPAGSRPPSAVEHVVERAAALDGAEREPARRTRGRGHRARSALVSAASARSAQAPPSSTRPSTLSAASRADISPPASPARAAPRQAAQQLAGGHRPLAGRLDLVDLEGAVGEPDQQPAVGRPPPRPARSPSDDRLGPPDHAALARRAAARRRCAAPARGRAGRRRPPAPPGRAAGPRRSACARR